MNVFLFVRTRCYCCVVFFLFPLLLRTHWYSNFTKGSMNITWLKTVARNHFANSVSKKKEATEIKGKGTLKRKCRIHWKKFGRRRQSLGNWHLHVFPDESIIILQIFQELDNSNISYRSWTERNISSEDCVRWGEICSGYIVEIITYF